MLSWENTAAGIPGGPALGEWLRRQRQARAWSRAEMARQLIKAARASGDTSLPGIDSICHNIYRWERGTVGLTERYRLYYCVALGLSPDDFGAGESEQPEDVSGFSAGEVAVLDLVAGVVGLWREFRRELAVIRDEAGGDGLAGIEAGTHGRSS
ncbi:MAG: helix-turn-helix transcriptional regulator [Streptosporangiaceae bacterium]|jgi:transcriptional regulator with XRE-family HTH domain